jgi:rhomboid protease GluP
MNAPVKKSTPVKIEFKQKLTVQVSLDELAPEQFINLVIEISKQLGWIFGDVNDAGIIAYTNNGLFAWNAEVKIKVTESSATLLSKCRENNYTDIRENKINVEKFISAFYTLKASTKALDELTIPQHLEMNVA